MIPIFDNKLLEDINESDLQRLKDEEIRENRFIEYKREYGSSNDEVTEMLADISAFANAFGGYLFVGIEEESNENPIPTNIGGINNPETEADRIRNRCESCIDEYIQGLQVQVVPVTNGNGVIIVYIPNSPRKPHMITFKKKNRFYVRRDEGKSLMNVEEIRDTVIRVEDYMRKLQNFFEERKQYLKIEVSNEPWLFLSACPIFLDDDRLDVALNKEINNLFSDHQFEPQIEKKLTCNTIIGKPQPILEGLRSEERYDVKRGKYLEVWNNGFIEFGYSFSYSSRNELLNRGFSDAQYVKTYLVNSEVVSDLIVSFCILVEKIIKVFRISDPIVYRVMILNSLDITIEAWSEAVYCKRFDLTIGPFKYYDIDRPTKITKDLITKFFREFGYMQPFYGSMAYSNTSRLFDEQSNYKP